MTARTLLAGAAVLLGVACRLAEPPAAVWVTIPPGASLEAVADTLAAHHIVTSARRFRKYVELMGQTDSIKPGTYPLRPRTPMQKVLPPLLEGRPLATPITVPPGVMLAELAPAIQAYLGIRADSVLAATRDPALRERTRARGATVEGYLYPTTYYVPLGSGARDLVRQMVDTFEARWQPEWDRRLDTLGLSRDELVTLASIIEGERPRERDRHRIASVYHNRLARGMRLQADPTVVYALGRRRRLSHKDLTLRSAYNTYRIDGLPPAPISQPSAASLEAALYPADTDFLYMVAHSDGRHVFSRSYREHLAAIRRVRRGGYPEGEEVLIEGDGPDAAGN